MVELDAGFAFVGRQVHIEVGSDDFYMDLLFYHLKLRCCLVVSGRIQTRTHRAIGLLRERGGLASQGRARQPDHWLAAVQEQKPSGG